MIEGDKSIFAVEYEIDSLSPAPQIYSCIWVQERFFGNPKMTGRLAAILSRLSRLTEWQGNAYEPEFVGKTPEEVMLTLIPNLYSPEKKFRDFTPEEQDQLVKYDKYLFGFGPSYDLFITRIYAIDGIYHFLWKFDPTYLPEDHADYFNNYDLNIQHAEASLEDIKRVYDALQKTYDELTFRS